MFSEWHRSRAAGHEARKTIGAFLSDGLVLDTHTVETIFCEFGLYVPTARNDFITLVDIKNDHLAQRIGIRVSRSHYWRPRIFWDAEIYKDVDKAFDGYEKRFLEMRERLQEVRVPKRLDKIASLLRQP
jgi:hypothetical protein